MRIYIDGELKHEDDPWGEDTYQWNRTTNLEIPKGAMELAIECLDLHVKNGIRASTNIGRFATDESWMCTSNEDLTDWAEPGFQDTNGDFSAASTTGNLNPYKM